MTDFYLLGALVETDYACPIFFAIFYKKVA